MEVRPWLKILLAAVIVGGAVALIAGIGSGSSGDSSSGGGSAADLPPGTRAAVVAKTAKVRLAKVGSFEQPTYVDAPPGDASRVFVVEKTGKIVVLLDGKKRSTPFLDISGSTTSDGERGLLSMAFAPDYANSGLFYVDYTDSDGDTRIVEYRRSASDPNRADESSRRQLMLIKQPFPNHNGGQLQFGPDKLLYIGMGDGGSAGDPNNNAQNLDSLLGKLLRIDPQPSGGKPYSIPASNPFVDRSGARPEIYTYGMRNPWRFSFDRKTGAIYIGDVGQENAEEVDYARQGGARGVNYGWSCREGRKGYDGSRRCPGARGPILAYSHDGGNCSITGGYVVRDPQLTALRGRYVYVDFCKGSLRSFKVVGGRATGDRALGIKISSPSSFGQDAKGRIYVTSLNGPVYRLKQ